MQEWVKDSELLKSGLQKRELTEQLRKENVEQAQAYQQLIKDTDVCLRPHSFPPPPPHLPMPLIKSHYETELLECCAHSAQRMLYCTPHNALCAVAPGLGPHEVCGRIWIKALLIQF